MGWGTRHGVLVEVTAQGAPQAASKTQQQCLVKSVSSPQALSARKRSGGVYPFDREAQPHSFEDGRQAAESRISLLRQGAVKLGRIQVGFLRYALHPAKGFGHLTQRDEKFSLFAVFKNAIQQFQRISGIFLNSSAMASSCVLSFIARFSFASPANIRKRGRCPYPGPACRLHRTTGRPGFRRSRNTPCILVQRQYVVPIPRRGKTCGPRSSPTRSYCFAGQGQSWLWCREACDANRSKCLSPLGLGSGVFQARTYIRRRG